MFIMKRTSKSTGKTITIIDDLVQLEHARTMAFALKIPLSEVIHRLCHDGRVEISNAIYEYKLKEA